MFQSLQRMSSRTDLSLIKTLAVVAMIAVHSRFFYSLRVPLNLPLKESPDVVSLWMAMNGMISLGLPILAGQELFERVKHQMVGGRLHRFPLWPFAGVLGLVALIDPLKGALAEGFVFSLRWNVLPMVSFSMVVTLLFLQYFSVNFLGLLILVTLALTLILQPMLSAFALKTPEQIHAFSHQSSSLLYLIIFLMAMFIFTYWVWRQFVQFKHSGVVFLLGFLVFAMTTYSYWQLSPSFAAATYNLPFGALVYLGKGGGHIWPLFPWASLVFFGFVLQWGQYQSNLRPWLHGVIFFVSLGLLLIQWSDFYESYRVLLGGLAVYNSAIFFLHPKHVLTLFALHTFCFYVLKLLACKSVRQNMLIKLTSSGILIIYVVHYVLAGNLVEIVLRTTPISVSLYVYSALVGLFSLGFSGLFIYFYQSRIRVSLRRVKDI